MDKSEFVVGRKYIVTREEHCVDILPHYRRKGTIVTAIHDNGSPLPRFALPNGVTDRFGDDWSYFHVENVEPYETAKHHTHHDLIIAWANGAEIQYLNLIGIWKTTKSPRWFIDRNYRIKPKEPTELEKLIKEHKAMGETIDKLTKELMNETD